jgi:hypothetical protein
MPRLHFPPSVLTSRLWGETHVSEGSLGQGRAELGVYLLVPVKLLLGEVVLLGMLEDVLQELGEDIFKLLERRLLRHLVVEGGG